METGWRRLPLHEACIRLALPDFIDILIEAYPIVVARRAASSNRVDIIAALSRGSEFYRKKDVKREVDKGA